MRKINVNDMTILQHTSRVWESDSPPPLTRNLWGTVWHCYALIESVFLHAFICILDNSSIHAQICKLHRVPVEEPEHPEHRADDELALSWPKQPSHSQSNNLALTVMSKISWCIFMP